LSIFVIDHTHNNNCVINMSWRTVKCDPKVSEEGHGPLFNILITTIGGVYLSTT